MAASAAVSSAGEARQWPHDVARRPDMMSPGSGASLADNLWHSGRPAVI
jgi:hypothetical protein